MKNRQQPLEAGPIRFRQLGKFVTGTCRVIQRGRRRLSGHKQVFMIKRQVLHVTHSLVAGYIWIFMEGVPIRVV